MNKNKYIDAIKILLDIGEVDKAIEIAIKHHDRKTWIADDGNCSIEFNLDSRHDAAQEYVAGGNWDKHGKTVFINVNTWPVYHVGDVFVEDRDDCKHIMISLHPEEPHCIDNDGHNWQSPHDLVGGIKENPGVWGHGGGLIIIEACIICGCERITDTWAQCPDSGIQGLTSIKYKENL